MSEQIVRHDVQIGCAVGTGGMSDMGVDGAVVGEGIASPV